MKVAFCGDLGEPNLAIVMESTTETYEQVEWLKSRGIIIKNYPIAGDIFLVTDAVRIEYLLRWG